MNRGFIDKKFLLINATVYAASNSRQNIRLRATHLSRFNSRACGSNLTENSPVNYPQTDSHDAPKSDRPQCFKNAQTLI